MIRVAGCNLAPTITMHDAILRAPIGTNDTADVKISNEGTDTLHVEDLVIGGKTSLAFGFADPLPTPTYPLAIAPGSAGAVRIIFFAREETSDTATLTSVSEGGRRSSQLVGQPLPALEVRESISSDRSLRVYPQPAIGGDVTVSGIETSARLELRDIVGRTVRLSPSGGSTRALDVATLPAGVYLLHAGAESRMVVVRR
jgi:hypothetical protein